VSSTSSSALPVASRVPEILQTLQSSKRLILSAEPGAGKSTLVPQALLESLDGKILVLEPRRVAAKLLASYVSTLVGTPLGQDVGYHVRFDRKANDKTRLIYLTEGLLRRYIQNDPFLTGVAAVVIDEFHERSLNGDVGLILLKKIQQELRPELQILVMSATLDSSKLSAFLDDAPIVKVPGRGFPVEISYSQKVQNPFDIAELGSKVVQAVRQLVESPKDDGGHLLVFLPGQREIRACEEALYKVLPSLPLRAGKPLVLLPLYSQLPESEIRRALDPKTQARKIILSTNIAESSVTLDGLTGVIDSGLQRRSNISLSHVIPYLELTRISRASAEQRAGRAGRQAPGRALRLWSESEHRFLEDFELPEVKRADPSEEILALLDIGFGSVREIPWIDAPDTNVLISTTHKLRTLQLIEDNTSQPDGQKITPLGRACLQSPIEIRWALFLEHLLAELGYIDEKSLLRICSSELSPRDREGDLESVIENKTALLRTSATYRSLQSALGSKLKVSPAIPDDIVLKALTKAFLDRLARVRNTTDSDKALMWGQRGLKLPDRARAEIHREDFILAFDLDDSQRGNEDSRLRVYRWVPRKLIETIFSSRITEKSWAEKDPKSGTLRFWRAKFLDDFQIQDPTPAAADPELLKQHQITEIIANWNSLEESETSLGQTLRRLKLWKRSPSTQDLTTLLSSLRSLPDTVAELTDSAAFTECLLGLFTYKERSELEALFPATFMLPRGRERRLDYRIDGRVFLSVRLPDLFGLATHPSIDRARLKLHLEILSPAQRPWQITQDLPNFWKSSYLEIRKEMKARYPRQPWPDDPSTSFE